MTATLMRLLIARPLVCGGRGGRVNKPRFAGIELRPRVLIHLESRHNASTTSLAPHGPKVSSRGTEAAWIVASATGVSTLAYWLYTSSLDDAHASHAHAHAEVVKQKYNYKGAVDFHKLSDAEQDILFPSLTAEQQAAVLDEAPVREHEVGETDGPTKGADIIKGVAKGSATALTNLKEAVHAGAASHETAAEHPKQYIFREPFTATAGLVRDPGQGSNTYKKAQDIPDHELRAAESRDGAGEDVCLGGDLKDSASASASTTGNKARLAQDIPTHQLREAQNQDAVGENVCNPATSLYNDSGRI